MKTSTNFDLNKLLRENIKNLKPYQSAREQFSESDLIFMDANENSFQTGYNRYPDPFQKELKAEIARLKNINTSSIFIGNGSDEIIDLIIRAFCIPGKDSILINVPTYGMYEVCAHINDVSIIKVELNDDFQINTEALFEKMNDAKIIFICSPNNPTGNSINIDTIEQIAESFNGLVVVDEAYADFSKKESSLRKLPGYQNLIVLQTFSKALAMAGIRIGMGFANPKVIEVLNKIKYPYNVSRLNQQTALKVLKENTSYESNIKTLLKQRQWLADELNQLCMVEKIWPSDANFLLVRFTDQNKVFNFLKDSGIIVRDRSKEPKCERCLRISIGTPEENVLLINSLKQLENPNNNRYAKDTIY